MSQISSGEANWLGNGFQRYFMEPSIQVIYVHLEGADEVIFNEATGAVESGMSKLLLYFARPSSLKHKTIREYFETYLVPAVKRTDLNDFDMSLCDGDESTVSHINSYGLKISRRKRGVSLARLEYVPLNAGDVYFLRLILMSCGVSSFVDALTVAGSVHESFRNAACSLNLFSEDREAEHVWLSGIESQLSAKALRGLFVNVALLGAPVDIYLDECSQLLAFDLPGDTEAEMHQELLLDLKSRFCGRSLSDFNIEAPVYSRYGGAGLGDEDLERAKFDAIRGILDADQVSVLQEVIASIAEYDAGGSGRFFFIQAPAGTGKTLLARAISSFCKSIGVPVFNSATCGLQARNLDGGKTNHNMYGLPVNDQRHVVSKFDVSSCSVENFVGGVHILDEAANQHSKNIGKYF